MLSFSDPLPLAHVLVLLVILLVIALIGADHYRQKRKMLDWLIKFAGAVCCGCCSKPCVWRDGDHQQKRDEYRMASQVCQLFALVIAVMALATIVILQLRSQ
jgi:hypothetical protein